MKPSQVMHVIRVLVGVAGVITFATAILGGADSVVLGVTEADALLCTGILVLIAIWLQIATIPHMLIEKRG